MSHLHKVFVYGTLKKNEPNHHWFSKSENGTAIFLGEAKTSEKYPLIIATKYNIPFLLYEPGAGHQVLGELYEVDDTTLNNLDILEDHPNYYIREQKPVLLLASNKLQDTWIYFLKAFKAELLKKPMLNSYSNNGSHGLKYTERYLRNPNYDYKTEVLSN